MVSLSGTWMTQTASLWLMYHLSSSAFMLGLTGFASLAPIFFLAPLAGVLVDRVDRHRLLVATQCAAMVQSLTLAIFALTDTLDVSRLLLLSLAQGFINAIDMPTRQALVASLVEDPRHLGSAIALNASLFNLARMLGPALGGLVIAAFGPGGCYLIDSGSFLAVIVALLAMRLPRRPARSESRRLGQDLREGFRYTVGHAPIRTLILLVGAYSAVGFSGSVLTPVFARDVFLGDARTLGWLMSASGFGAVLGALYLSTRSGVQGLEWVILAGGLMVGAGLVGFAASRWLPLSLVCQAVAGAGGVGLMASCNTLVQTLVEDSKRGRVMSFYAMAFTGTMPLGNLMAGVVAGRLGAAVTLGICGVACFAIMAGVFRRVMRFRALTERVAEP